MALVDAALALFDERGYADTTVAQVADVAGVSPRTAFRYFPQKSDLLVAEHHAQLERWGHELAGQPAGRAPAEAARRASGAVAADLWQRERFWRQLRGLLLGQPELASSVALAQARARAQAARAVAERTSVAVDDPRACALADGALRPLELRVEQAARGGPEELPEPAHVVAELGWLDALGQLLPPRASA